MFTQSQVMYSLSRKQANECSIRPTGTNKNNRPLRVFSFALWQDLTLRHLQTCQIRFDHTLLFLSYNHVVKGGKKMKFLLLGDDDYKRLFVEDDEGICSLRYDFKTEEWVYGGSELHNNRVGFDSSEPIDSPYRYGNGSCMEKIVEITKVEAESFISKAIDEKEIINFLIKSKFVIIL